MKQAIAVFLLLAGSLMAQGQASYATITGTVTDPNGNPFAFARLTATLVNSGGVPLKYVYFADGSRYVVPPVGAVLGSNGAFSISVLKNTSVVTPSGTQWQFTLTDPANPGVIITYAPSWSITYTATVTADASLTTPLTTRAQSIYFANLFTGQNNLGTSYVLPKATTLILGGVKPDGTTCTTDGNGVLTCPGSGTGYVFVQSLTVSSPVPALTFSAIPQTARDLQLTCTGSESAANDVSNQLMTTNSDSSNHYYWVLSTNYDGTPGGATSSALTGGAIVGVFNGTSTTGVGTFTVNIPNYTNATFANHQFTGTATVKRTSQTYTFQTSGFWNQAAAITRIDVADAGTANFTSGTTCVLRGLP